MPEVMLDGAGVLVVIGEFVACDMPPHVRMDREADPGLFAGPCDNLSRRVRGQWGFVLADEDMGRFQLLRI